jgi:hypothetical protein
MRTYTTTEGPVPLTEPDRDDDVLVKPFPVVWRPRAELPSRDDTPRELLQMRDELDDVGALDPWTDRTGLKVGGWPRTIQSETSWHLGRHGLVADAEFVLQIDSTRSPSSSSGTPARRTSPGRRPTGGS